MAGSSESNRDIWQLVSASFVHQPKELVGNALKHNKTKLMNVLDHYTKPNTPSGEKLKKERKVEPNKVDFVLKLSKFLALDEVLAFDLNSSFMVQDYRGSQRNLENVLNSERQSRSLLHKIRDFYQSERVYLLHTLKHIISYHQEEGHAYRELFGNFLKPVFESTDFIDKVMKQYEGLCDTPAPTWQTLGSYMTERESAVWLAHNLREQCELLEIILLYHTYVQLSTAKLLSLLQRFKRQGFGRRQVNKHLLDETSEPVLQRIGFIQSLLVLKGLHLDELSFDEDGSGRDNKIVKSREFKELCSIATGLGDLPEHTPVLMAISLILHVTSDPQWAGPSQGAGSTLARKLGHKALQHRVFHYLAARLRQDPFSSNSVFAQACRLIVYKLLNAVLWFYHENSLGDTEGLYEAVTAVLHHPKLSDELLEQGVDEGLGLLVQSALTRWPLHFSPPLQLMIPLMKASLRSRCQVVALLHRLEVFMEYWDSSVDVGPVRGEEGMVESRRARCPYPDNASLVIPARTRARLHPQPEGVRDVLRWEVRYSAFDVFLGESQVLLLQLQQGGGMVQASSMEKVRIVCDVLQAVMCDDVRWALDNIPQLPQILDTLHQVMHRICQGSQPSLELLAAILAVVGCEVKLHPEQVWHELLQTGLLPFLTENIDSYSEAVSGAGVNTGAYGRLLAGCECSEGQYPVSLALLPLISSLIQPLHQAGRLDELMAIVIFLTREVFPSFHKWRFYLVNSREKLGQRCLDIFHQMLNILPEASEQSALDRPGVREVCVYSLLYTESGRTLLDIIGLGVDAIETALASQSSVHEGAGVELTQLVRLAISLLNRLLLLRPPGLPISPTERCLSSQPLHHQGNAHPMATIARYIYHRHDPRLPSLTTLLLKRLAMVFPMSLLACLGNEAEAMRDIYLARLKSHTEDVRLKVVMLELLSVCVDTQPGLIEMFLNIEGPAAAQNKKQELSVGESSCLQSLLALIDQTKQQQEPECPSELLCAAMQFVHALWKGRRETAMAVLRRRDEFWQSICLSLTRDLMARSMDATPDMLSTEMKTVAYIMKILALEIYHIPSSKVDKGLQSVLNDLVSAKRLEYWSKYIRESMKETARTGSGHAGQREGMVDNATLQMLLAWRDLLLVLAASKTDLVRLTDSCRAVILDDLLQGVEAQFGGTEGLKALHLKLASIASTCYFSLLKHWISAVSDRGETALHLERVLNETSNNSEVLLPSVQIGILASLTHILQHSQASKGALQPTEVQSLLGVVCSILQQSTYQLPKPLPKRTTDPVPAHSPPDQPHSTQEDIDKDREKNFEIKIKLQCATVCLLEEIVRYLDNPSLWLPCVQHHAVVGNLIHSLLPYIQSRQGLAYVETTLHFLTTLANHPQGAELVTSSGLSQQLCVVLTELCLPQSPLQRAQKQSATCGVETDKWQGIYILYTSLMTSLLMSLKYSALQDCLNFVGVHQDTMHQCLCSVRINEEGIKEALQTARFLAELSHYHRDWRLHLLPNMLTLMRDISVLSNRCVALLVRPRLLQHMLENGSSSADSQKEQQLVQVPVVRRLSSQSSSTDDSDSVSHATMMLQHSFMELLSHCLAATQQFSPDLCEILLDQSMDVSEYDPCLDLVFSTPAADTDSSTTFGTLVTVLNMGLKLLPKTVGGAVSPVKGLDMEGPPFKKSVVLYVMETSLMLLMEQAVRYLKQPNLSARDKQLLKRELGTELTSFQLSLQRHIRRGPGSPANSMPSPQPSSSKLQVLSSSSLGSSQEYCFFRLIDVFVRQVLR